MSVRTILGHARMAPGWAGRRCVLVRGRSFGPKMLREPPLRARSNDVRTVRVRVRARVDHFGRHPLRERVSAMLMSTHACIVKLLIAYYIQFRVF